MPPLLTPVTFAWIPRLRQQYPRMMIETNPSEETLGNRCIKGLLKSEQMPRYSINISVRVMAASVMVHQRPTCSFRLVSHPFLFLKPVFSIELHLPFAYLTGFFLLTSSSLTSLMFFFFRVFVVNGFFGPYSPARIIPLVILCLFVCVNTQFSPAALLDGILRQL